VSVNWTAVLAVLALAALAAVVWISLAAKLVADEEKTRERAEAELRRLEHLREAQEEERNLAARIEADLSLSGTESTEEDDEPAGEPRK